MRLSAHARVPAVRLLFVCLGNICRSPTAEAVMRRLLEQEGLADAVTIDSAGTGSYHLGSGPDPRSTAAARERGITLAGTARRVTADDFSRFDLIVAMDGENRDDLLRVAPDADARGRIVLLREFDPLAVERGDLDVPDPYYGEHGFSNVLDVIDRACRGLLQHVRREL